MRRPKILAASLHALYRCFWPRARHSGGSNLRGSEAAVTQWVIAVQPWTAEIGWQVDSDRPRPGSPPAPANRKGAGRGNNYLC